MANNPYSGPWTAVKVRQEFFNYFKSKQHTFVPSSPTIPYEDPTLLFANAGMNQASFIYPETSGLSHIFNSTNPSSWAPLTHTLKCPS